MAVVTLLVSERKTIDLHGVASESSGYAMMRRHVPVSCRIGVPVRRLQGIARPALDPRVLALEPEQPGRVS